MPSMVIRTHFLDFDLTVRGGALKTVADYDDAWLFFLIQRSRAFYDVGCNVGFFSLLAGLTDKTRKVVAIDPNPRALSETAETLFLNGIAEQVTFVAAGVSDHEKDNAAFHTVGSGAAGSFFKSHAKTAARQNKSMQVKLTTLDSILKKTEIVPDLIKMDIEGYEWRALKGAVQIAQLKKTRFLIEVHSNPELPMKENGQHLLDWCGQNGYDAYYLSKHEKLNDVEPFVKRGRCHLLLQPSGWAYPEGLNQISQGDPLEKAYLRIGK